LEQLTRPGDDPAQSQTADENGDGRKRTNDLDGVAWTRYSISVWSDIRKSSEEIELNHPAIFPAQLVTRLVECFTRKDERIILDPFCGSGSTVVAASKLGRVGIGFEVNPAYVELANTRLLRPELWQTEVDRESTIYRCDARRLRQHLEPDSVDMVITSPPYWDILSQKRTADGKSVRDYGDITEDLGKIESYEEFLDQLAGVFRPVYEVLRPGKYCIVVVMDLRKKNTFYPFHADIARMMEHIGFIYDDLIIWDRHHEYNNLRPLGYPSVFRINKCHEYILIFQKPGQ
jgi:DNA modification methylase